MQRYSKVYAANLNLIVPILLSSLYAMSHLSYYTIISLISASYLSIRKSGKSLGNSGLIRGVEYLTERVE